jgi:hypothetical protein
MRNLRLAPLAILLCLFAGCGRPSVEDYIATCRDGLVKLKPADQLEHRYAEVDHFITHFGFGKQPLEWQTVAFIEGRFELTVVIPIRVDYTKRTVTQTEKPKFYLVAAKEIRGSATTLDDKLDRKFGEAEWERFVHSGFDLGSLGIPKAEIHPVPHWEDHVRGWRKDRVSIK